MTANIVLSRFRAPDRATGAAKSLNFKETKGRDRLGRA
jgi:hypothetical protein